MERVVGKHVRWAGRKQGPQARVRSLEQREDTGGCPGGDWHDVMKPFTKMGM